MNTYYVTGYRLMAHPADPYGDNQMFKRVPEPHFIEAESADGAIALARSVGLRVKGPEDCYCVRVPL